MTRFHTLCRTLQVRAAMVAAMLASLASLAGAADESMRAPVNRYATFLGAAQVTEILYPSDDANCQPTPRQPGVAFTGRISGAGLATPMGDFTLEATDCIRSSNPVDFTPPFTFSSRSVRLTAANGDQIFGSYNGAARMSTPGLLILSGSFVFTGGTGRFSRARGVGELTGVENLGAMPVSGFFSLKGLASF